MRIIDWIVPVRPVAAALGSLSAGVRVLIGLGLIMFVGALAAVILLSNAIARHTAERAASRFATAVIHDDPRAAPPGAQNYVAGLRAYFGPVYRVHLVGAHNHGADTSQYSHAFYQADLLLGTRRGPAVIELAFDNYSLTSQRVTSIYELRPADAPGLSDAQRRALAVAFKARGGKPATALTLAAGTIPKFTLPTVTGSGANGHVKASSRPPLTQNKQATGAMNQLRCVQRAHGDITKLQACSRR